MMMDVDSIMKQENLSAVLHAAKDLRMEHHPIPSVGSEDVLLAMRSVGICGSDIKYWAYGKCGRFSLDGPMVIGHEASGQVLALGSNVKHLKIGDRVAVEPGVPCRKCRVCKHGRYNLCADVQFCATPPVHGNLCRYYVHPADFCFKLPDNVTDEEGALMEPLAVAVYSCERGGVTTGSRVLICGAGPIGLLTMMTARAMGAQEFVVTDIDDHRLAIAKQYGADHAVNVSDCGSALEVAQRVQDVMGDAPDLSFECSGSDISLAACIHATGPGGSIVMVGRGSLEVTLPLVLAGAKELDIKGIFRYANAYPKALSMLSNGTIDVKSLVTHRFSLQEVEQAFLTASDREAKSIKVMINC